MIICFLGVTDPDEMIEVAEFYCFWLDNLNIIAKKHLLHRADEEKDEEPGPSRKKQKGDGKTKFKKKPWRSCVPHPNTLAG